MTARIVLALQIITKDDLGAWVIGIIPVAQEFRNVLDILVASIQLMLATGVVDANEEGLLTHHVSLLQASGGR